MITLYLPYVDVLSMCIPCEDTNMDIAFPMRDPNEPFDHHHQFYCPTKPKRLS